MRLDKLIEELKKVQDGNNLPDDIEVSFWIDDNTNHILQLQEVDYYNGNLEINLF